MSRYRSLAAAVAALLAVSILPLVSASAREQSAVGSDIREISDLGNGKLLPVDVDRGDVTAARRTNAAAPGAYEVGSRRRWLASDDYVGVYLKNYRLRGVGKHIEVWVATGKDKLCDGDPETTEDCPRGNEEETVTGTHFPDGDCRNDRVAITTDQVNYLIDEFDNNMYPKESRRFSVPPNKNGKNAPLTELANLPQNYFKGEGDNIVVLIDNVRDDNFYDTNNSEQRPYIAGFFSSTFNYYLKRNVMTIDAFDWLHRTGSNPPNEPVPGDGCLNASARPHLYEGVFAHEYQHLLEGYEDPNEGNWTNEGLSDYAGRITGYFDTKKPITEIGFESHVQCFFGNTGTQTPANPLPSEGGPSNSLNLWGDQGGDDILCDYGAAATFMEWLNDTYGKDFMTRLHRINKNGFKGLNADLNQEGASDDAIDSIHKWLASMALDGVLDDGATLTGGDAATYQVRVLDAAINWDAPKTHLNNPEGPQVNEGAPPNGADFVRLRAANGDYLAAGDLRSLGFQGSTTLPAAPQANPVEVAGFTLQLVAYTDDHTKAWLAQVPINPENMSASLDAAALEAALGTEAQTVAAIITYDEPTEQVNQYAPYTLTVNNKEQAGGS